MKKKFLILLITFSFTSFGQETELEKLVSELSEKEGYTTVFITKYMFDLFKKTDIDEESSKAISLINSIVIVTKEGKTEDDFRMQMDKLLPKKKYELLMRVKNKEEDIVFMIKKHKEKIVEFIMSVNSDEKTSLVYIGGDFSMEELNKMSKSMNIDGLDYLKTNN